jgi:hypothetical protein
MEVNVSVVARTTDVLQSVLLTVVPHGGQRIARSNALVAATAARTTRWERAEAFATFDRVRRAEPEPAAS